MGPSANSEKPAFRFERVLRLASFLGIALALICLYGFTAYQAWLVYPLGDVAVVVLMIGIIYTLVSEARELNTPDDGAKGILSCVQDFGCVLIGAALAYTLNVEIGIGAVLAASLVSLMVAILVPAYSVPLALGGFVGMTSSRLLAGYGDLSYAAAIAGLVYLGSARVFNGFGGKLGTIAFVGTFITGSGLSREFEITAFPEWDSVVVIILIPILSAVLTYWLSVHRNHGPVLASGVVGITAGLWVPFFFPGAEGQTFAVMALCASYAGMTGKARIPNLKLMVLVGLFSGMIFVFSMPLAGGAGGKLGTIAFGSVLAVRGYVDILEKIRNRFNGSQTQHLDKANYKK